MLKKKQILNKQEFKSISDKIKTILKNKSSSIDDLIYTMTEFEDKKILETIDFLVENDKLKIKANQHLVWID